MPPTPQTAFRLAQPEREWLTRLGKDMAGQLREDLATLQRLGRTPALSESEWGCLRDILNGTAYDPSLARSLPLILASEVEDSGPDGMADRWGVDLAGLAARLRALHPADAWAVWNQVRDWWAAQRRGAED